MKFATLSKIILTSLLVCASAQSLFAETSASAPKLGDIITTPNAAFMLVREFNTPEENDTFNRNVEVMRQSASQITALENALKNEKEPAKKSAIEDAIKRLENTFKANDVAMRRAYSFASDRKYKMVFLKTNLCSEITNAELSELKNSKGEDLDPMRVIKKNGSNYYRLRQIEGEKANDEFQRDLNKTLAAKINIDKMRAELAKMTDDEKQMVLAGKISEQERIMKNSDAQFRKKYGLDAKVNYIIEIAHSRLFLILTSQELQMIKAQRETQNAKK